MDAVDTSVLVRYLLGDPLDASQAAARLIDSQNPVAISLVALAATAFVLNHHYQVPRETTVDHLVGFLRKHNVRVLGTDKNLVASALLLCRPSGRISFADALINAEARSGNLNTL